MTKPKKPKLTKQRNMAVPATINKSGAGHHTLNEDKRKSNKELKELQEQLEEND